MLLWLGKDEYTDEGRGIHSYRYVRPGQEKRRGEKGKRRGGKEGGEGGGKRKVPCNEDIQVSWFLHYTSTMVCAYIM